MRGAGDVELTTDEILAFDPPLRPGTIVDSSVLLDVFTEDASWAPGHWRS